MASLKKSKKLKNCKKKGFTIKLKLFKIMIVDT